MKLIKLYSNKEFKNTEFNLGFNVIFGKTMDKKNYDKDTHNLGKTSFMHVIDFLLLRGVSNELFLIKYKEKFSGYIFYLEILLDNGEYLIIKRNVDNPSKIYFKTKKEKLEGFIYDIDWDIKGLSFEKSKEYLNERLNFTVLRDWSYRKSLNYFLRSQSDYSDVFQLNKFKGKHKNWKPFLFNLLGFDGSILRDKYDIEETKFKLDETIREIEHQFTLKTDEIDKLRGIIELKEADLKEIEKRVDNFNFYTEDKDLNKKLLDSIDSEISQLNTIRYSLSYEKENLEKSLEKKINGIKISQLDEIYKEVSIFFPKDLIKKYEELEEFNLKISKERSKYLIERLKVVNRSVQDLENNLINLDEKRSELLLVLKDKNSYDKFKYYQKQLVESQSEVSVLREKLSNMQTVGDLERRSNQLTDNINDYKEKIQYVIAESNEFYKLIRKTFNDIVKTITGSPALISITQNKKGNITFNAEIQDYKELEITAGSLGSSYKKVLCAAFDISLLIAYKNKQFFKFVYHDGILEALDDRKKINFLNLINSYCKKYGIQYILTIIDSDLPKDENGLLATFDKNEIIIELGDRDDKDRLFGMSF